MIGKSVNIREVHRSTAMLMLKSPHIPRGAQYADAVHPIHVATTVKVASTRVMERAFRSLVEFDPATVDDIAGVERIYRRIGNPSEVYANMAMTLAEGVGTDTHWAMAFSDGMRAINAALEFRLQPGDEIVVSKPLYGCTDNYFDHWAGQHRGYVVKYVDLTDPEAIRTVLSKKTKTIYFETEANPNLRVYDLEKIAAIVREVCPEAMIIVDNTFPGPAGCNPLLHGADIVVHSATKVISGSTQEMAGFGVLPKTLWVQLFLFRKDTGGVPAPEQIHHVLTRGLPTLYDRFGKMQHNARLLARFLHETGDFRHVFYPGEPDFRYYGVAQRHLTDWDNNFAPGYMVSFVPDGRTEAARYKRAVGMCNYFARYGEGVVNLQVSLGGIGDMLNLAFYGVHFTVSAEEKLQWGIERSLVRLSVGLAHSDDRLQLFDDARN